MNRPAVALLSIATVVLFGCGEFKRISKGNYLYKYKDNQSRRNRGDTSAVDRYYVYLVTKTFKSKVEDKIDYLLIKDKDALKSCEAKDSIRVIPPDATKVIVKSVYTSEPAAGKYQKSFRYFDTKFAIQTLTIPLKFRKALDDGTKFPEQVETGINIGFAPVVKFNLNLSNPIKKYMGKSTNQYSLNTGAIINLGATDLKAASNAPGIKSDRKSALFTYGTFLMIGVNNINFGYAIGWDKVIGEGKDNWVYQDRSWHGVIIALDIIKP